MLVLDCSSLCLPVLTGPLYTENSVFLDGLCVLSDLIGLNFQQLSVKFINFVKNIEIDQKNFYMGSPSFIMALMAFFVTDLPLQI